MNYNRYLIQVPATSANLGSGFDTLGIAFNIYNRFIIQALNEPTLIIEGVEKEYQNKDNLIYTSILKVFDKLKIDPPGIKIIENNNIPFGKGLGSSASCIVGGLVAGNLIADNKLSKQDLLNLAVEIEGYPDNVSTALFGNLTASMVLENETVSLINEVSPVFNFSILIPDFELPTKQAREILPSSYDIKDSVYNISHSILTYESLIEGKPDILSKALGDRLHQPHRFKLIPDYKEFKKIFDSEKVLGSYLSGAGPSIVFITRAQDKENRENIKNTIERNFKNWEFVDLEVEKDGTKKEILN